MKLNIIGKNMDIGDSLRQYVEDNLKNLTEKYFSNPLDGKVVVYKDAHLYQVDISVHVGRNILLQATGSASEPYPAFDTAAEHVEKRLRRYKRKLRDHNRDEAAGTRANQYIIDHQDVDAALAAGASDEPHGEPVVVAELPMVIEELTVSEAVMRMDLGQLPALMFKNRAHGGYNMVYRHPDGHIGWVDPETINAVHNEKQPVTA